MVPFVVAIDGPAGAGKGTLAVGLAAALGLPHLDTGLLYRAVGKAMADAQLDLDDADAATRVATEIDLSSIAVNALRGSDVGAQASRVAVHPGVRAALVAHQRRFAATPPGAVLDGRDIGTVICPEADVKIFVTASVEVRARRRSEELLAAGIATAYETVLAEIIARDTRDSARASAPLRPADDAVLLDTSHLDRDGALRAALAIVDARLGRTAGHPRPPLASWDKDATLPQHGRDWSHPGRLR